MAASVPPSTERERYSAEHAFRLRAGLICPLSGSAGYAEVIRHASCKSNLYLQLLGATYYNVHYASTTDLRSGYVPDHQICTRASNSQLRTSVPYGTR
jgi:hypothetical protein